MSAEWPSRTRFRTAPTWMIRAKTCASGRNNRVEASSSSNSACELVGRADSSDRKLPCVSTQPFGRPVVPEV